MRPNNTGGCTPSDMLVGYHFDRRLSNNGGDYTSIPLILKLRIRGMYVCKMNACYLVTRPLQPKWHQLSDPGENRTPI